MKKIAVIFVFSIMVLCLNCAKNVDEKTVNGFWFDDDTYRVEAIGYSSPDMAELSYVQRSESACYAARLVARGHIMQVFSENELETIKSNKTEQGFSGKIRAGRLVERTVDVSGNKCFIIYEISEPGLKKKIAK